MAKHEDYFARFGGVAVCQISAGGVSVSAGSSVSSSCLPLCLSVALPVRQSVTRAGFSVSWAVAAIGRD